MLKYYYSLLLFIAFHISTTVSAGRTDTLRRYYADNWAETTADNAAYSRKAWKTKLGWEVRDYYYDGMMQMKGTYTDTTFTKKNGLFTWYNFKGRPSKQGIYKNDRKGGKWRAWNDDGKGDYEINYHNNEYDGKAKWYHTNGKVSEEATYANGKLLKARYWNEKGKPDKNGTDEETVPAFPASPGHTLMDFLLSNLRYPDQARETGTEGTVKVSFTVGWNGVLEDIKAVQSAGPLLNAEALRVIKKMPKWIPGRNHNRVIRGYYTLPVVFQLD